MCEFNDVEVCAVSELENNEGLTAEWVCVFADNSMKEFDTEDMALDYQRAYRVKHGRDPLDPEKPLVYSSDAEYVKKPNTCPVCKCSGYVVAGDLTDEGDAGYREIECENCGSTFNETWEIVGYDSINISLDGTKKEDTPVVNEILQVIRCSANIPEVLATYIVPSENDDPVKRKEIVDKAEDLFREKLGYSVDDENDMEELEFDLDNGYGEESDGDTVILIWSTI